MKEKIENTVSTWFDGAKESYINDASQEMAPWPG